MNAALSTLRLKRVGIDTWRENVAFLHRSCPVVRAAGFQALAKVTVRADGQSIAAVLNVVDDEGIVGPMELGLSEEAFDRLAAAQGHGVTVEHAEPPPSIAALHRKIAGDRLSRDDLFAVMKDVAGARYSKIELAAFVVATNQFELDRDEVLHLTEAMIDVGRRIDWRTRRDGRAGGRQALHRRHPGQPHVDAGGAHRHRARHVVPQDQLTRDHLACRHRRHDGGAGRRGAADRSACSRSCEKRAAAWPGAARPTCRRPTTS